MGFYSDPTAAKALGNINREFSKFENKAKKLKKLLEEGKISADALERAQTEFTGIYKHVLKNVLRSQSVKN